MKNVLFVAYDFPPAVTPGTRRTERFVKFLPAFQWQASVLTTAEECKTNGAASGTGKELAQQEFVEYTTFLRTEDRIRHFISAPGRAVQRFLGSAGSKPVACAKRTANRVENRKKKSWLRARLQELLFELPDTEIGWKPVIVRTGKQLVDRLNIDCIVATGPPFTAHVAAAKLSRQTRRPLVLDFRDPWSRCPWGPRAKGNLARYLLARMERDCVNQASKVVLNTEPLADEFRNYYHDQPPEKFAVITNGFDPDLYHRIKGLTRSLSIEKNGRAPLLLHPGSLYSQRDPTSVLQAMSLLAAAGQPVEFEQLGPCDPVFRLAERAANLGLNGTVKVSQSVSYDQALLRMAEADLLLLIQPGTDLQVPAKLFEMILFGKPIVAVTDEGATADIIRRFRLGSVASSKEPKTIAQAIRDALDMRTTIDDDARKAVLNEFDGRLLTKKLAHILELTSASRYE